MMERRKLLRRDSSVTWWNPTADDLMADDWKVLAKESWTITESYIIQKNREGDK